MSAKTEIERVVPTRLSRLLEKDRRLNRRVRLSIAGRYLLPTGDDFPLDIENISCGGAYLRSDERPEVGTSLVCYIDELGRISASVVRHDENGFAVRFGVTSRKADKIADKLTWLANYQALGLTDDRNDTRFAGGGTVRVERENGQSFDCRVVDISLSGAALESPVATLLLGEIVQVGSKSGEVIRTAQNGFAIRFIKRAASGPA